MCIDEYSLQSFHSRAAERKPTHTKALTLNAVIIQEQKFRKVRHRSEKVLWRKTSSKALRGGQDFDRLLWAEGRAPAASKGSVIRVLQDRKGTLDSMRKDD